MGLPKVAFIGTGGTIAAIGATPLDLRDYSANSVMMHADDEIHAARDVTKTSTTRLQTFRSADFGALGHADGDAIAFYRRPIRKVAPDTEFDVRNPDALPRVDIAYSYAGSDATAVRAFVAAGAKGLIVEGFASGMVTPQELEAMKAAVAEDEIERIFLTYCDDEDGDER